MNLYEAVKKNIREAEEKEFIKKVKDVNGTFFDIYKKDGKYVDANNVPLSNDELKEYKLLEADSAKTYEITLNYTAEGYPSDAEANDIEDSVVDPYEISTALEKLNAREHNTETSWDGNTLEYKMLIKTAKSMEEVEEEFNNISAKLDVKLCESSLIKESFSSISWDDLDEDIQEDIANLNTVSVMKCDDCDSIVKTDDVTETKQVNMEALNGVASDFPDHHYQDFPVCPKCGSTDIHELGRLDYTDFEYVFDEDGNMR